MPATAVSDGHDRHQAGVSFVRGLQRGGGRDEVRECRRSPPPMLPTARMTSGPSITQGDSCTWSQVALVAAIAAEEGQDHRARHVERGQQRDEEAHHEQRLPAGVPSALARIASLLK